jgi:micrococcal nuclease
LSVRRAETSPASSTKVEPFPSMTRPIAGKTFSAAIVVLLFAAPVWAIGADAIRGTVAHVWDGDSLVLKTDAGITLDVRLANIDSPETRKINGRKADRVVTLGQPFGEKARQVLESKVLLRRVLVEVDDIDRYGRSVGVVFSMGRNVNVEMVNEGWAWAYTSRFRGPYLQEYLSAESHARTLRLGLWRQAQPEPPWEFRRSMRADRDH